MEEEENRICQVFEQIEAGILGLYGHVIKWVLKK
jgi:hypothetical protein